MKITISDIIGSIGFENIFTDPPPIKNRVVVLDIHDGQVFYRHQVFFGDGTWLWSAQSQTISDFIEKHEFTRECKRQMKKMMQQP